MKSFRCAPLTHYSGVLAGRNLSRISKRLHPSFSSSEKSSVFIRSGSDECQPQPQSPISPKPTEITSNESNLTNQCQESSDSSDSDELIFWELLSKDATHSKDKNPGGIAEPSTSSQCDSRCGDTTPLVFASKMGEKRKIAQATDLAVDELRIFKIDDQGGENRKPFRLEEGKEELRQDLPALLLDNPQSAAVVSDYMNKGRLTEGDRSTILSVLVPWLLKQTDCPEQVHYETLARKVCALFPSEDSLVWYLPPKSEGPNHPYPRGKLADQVKNSETKPRQKGYLPATSKMRTLPQTDLSLTALPDEEIAAMEWLKRLREPFTEVRSYWGKCARTRLQKLLSSFARPLRQLEFLGVK